MTEPTRALGRALAHGAGAILTVLLVWWLAGIAGAPDPLRGALAVAFALAPGAYGWSTLDLMGRPLGSEVGLDAEEEATFRLDGATLRRAPDEELCASDFAFVARLMPEADAAMRDAVARLTRKDWCALPDGDPREAAVMEALQAEMARIPDWAVDGRAPLVAFLLADLSERMGGQAGRDTGATAPEAPKGRLN